MSADKTSGWGSQKGSCFRTEQPVGTEANRARFPKTISISKFHLLSVFTTKPWFLLGRVLD